MLDTLIAPCIVGAINAGIVSAGMNALYLQFVFGLVIVVSVVLQTVIERRLQRRPIISNWKVLRV